MVVPCTDHYFALVDDISRDLPFNRVFLLVEVNYANMQNSFVRPFYHSIMTHTESTRDAILAPLTLDEDCQDLECTLMLDGRYVFPDQDPMRIFDGSFMRIWLGPEHSLEDPEVRIGQRLAGNGGSFTSHHQLRAAVTADCFIWSGICKFCETCCSTRNHSPDTGLGSHRGAVDCSTRSYHVPTMHETNQGERG